jgi:hypothetical protein
MHMANEFRKESLKEMPSSQTGKAQMMDGGDKCPAKNNLNSCNYKQVRAK